MKRYAAQLIFISEKEILKRVVVEQSDDGVISAFVSLDHLSVEPADTEFLDGIISPAVVSVKEGMKLSGKADLSGYNYVDVVNMISAEDLTRLDLPLILDFGTSEIGHIQRNFSKISRFLENCSLNEIVAACVFRPARVLNLTVDMKVGETSDLILWQQADIPNFRFKAETKLQRIKKGSI